MIQAKKPFAPGRPLRLTWPLALYGSSLMHRILALIALVAFAIGSSSAFACESHVASTVPQQSVASIDGGSTPILVPTGNGS
jgi:hypothetical protein